MLAPQELNSRLDEVAESEEQVKCVNRELSGQMAEMVREFDEDKKQALQKYVYLLFIAERYVHQ